ncbi:2-dehydro-3-deoxygalactonokinase [Enterovirga rhinocerotis]|uniref:2-dehydro-3-deoxygalactonokinase n=1 Tax=Enterovirga rhinocerotis TaxID=1339210 RepID=A0A4R7BJH3_9HYPH|nr:2-dehydro-3-deoxygalactonokinase [Enterovirga rhinocerotis]TDR85418.1 2-dehydro-3-deoxygalactonokinase [Enterovirga rhinocerotis]
MPSAPRFVAVDWGTSRLRAALVEDGRVVGRSDSDEGIGRLRVGEHEAAFARVCGAWLAAEPSLPVALVGMVGSREGWFPAPYASCPAGAAEIAAGALAVDLPHGATGFVVPGLRFDEDGRVDVMRGEETHLLGSAVVDGLVCLPGTHCKWALMTGGRIARFASFMTGEMHALLREHSMIGRPATEPGDPAGFARGLAIGMAAAPGGLLNLLFEARAATVAGAMSPACLGPYLSGLLTGQEITGAFRLFGRPTTVTVVADEPRAALYRDALGSEGIGVTVLGQEPTLLAGIAAILAAR